MQTSTNGKFRENYGDKMVWSPRHVTCHKRTIQTLFDDDDDDTLENDEDDTVNHLKEG